MRRAVDTNILVRLFARDDSQQWQKASKLLDDGSIVVSATVLLETEWVLRSVLGYGHAVVRDLFAALLALPNVELVEEERIITALRLEKAGMDLADAMHVTGIGSADEFATFDKELVRLAKKAAPETPIRLL